MPNYNPLDMAYMLKMSGLSGPITDIEMQKAMQAMQGAQGLTPAEKAFYANRVQDPNSPMGTPIPMAAVPMQDPNNPTAGMRMAPMPQVGGNRMMQLQNAANQFLGQGQLTEAEMRRLMEMQNATR